MFVDSGVSWSSSSTQILCVFIFSGIAKHIEMLHVWSFSGAVLGLKGV